MGLHEVVGLGVPSRIHSQSPLTQGLGPRGVTGSRATRVNGLVVLAWGLSTPSLWKLAPGDDGRPKISSHTQFQQLIAGLLRASVELRLEAGSTENTTVEPQVWQTFNAESLQIIHTEFYRSYLLR